MNWEVIKDWWFLILAAAGAVVFAVKADSRSRENALGIANARKDMELALEKLERQRDKDLQQAEKSREETNAVLREMRDDQRASAKTLQEFLRIIVSNQHPGE